MGKYVVFLVFIFASFGLYAGLFPSQTYGPWTCDNGCSAQYPIPDSRTLDFINEREVWDSPMFFGFMTDDVIVICTASACTTYIVTASGDYLGVKKEPIDPPPEDENDGGGGSWGGGPPPSGGGGPGGPSGCVAGCNPNVDVGDPEQTQP